MAEDPTPFAEGGCTCGEIRYRLLRDPIVVHCCHCSWCQRESGSAFALNAVIEATEVELTGGTPQTVITPSASQKGQEVLRCPTCRVAVWSHYAGAGAKASFIRVGTLDDPALCPPDVHIFTSSRLDWFDLRDGVEQFDAFYSGKDVPRIYGEDGAARWKALREA